MWTTAGTTKKVFWKGSVYFFFSFQQLRPIITFLRIQFPSCPQCLFLDTHLTKFWQVWPICILQYNPSVCWAFLPLFFFLAIFYIDAAFFSSNRFKQRVKNKAWKVNSYFLFIHQIFWPNHLRFLSVFFLGDFRQGLRQPRKPAIDILIWSQYQIGSSTNPIWHKVVLYM